MLFPNGDPVHNLCLAITLQALKDYAKASKCEPGEELNDSQIKERKEIKKWLESDYGKMVTNELSLIALKALNKDEEKVIKNVVYATRKD